MQKKISWFLVIISISVSISIDVSIDIMKKTGLYGFAYDVSVDYDSIDVDDISDNHKYVMKKRDIK